MLSVLVAPQDALAHSVWAITEFRDLKAGKYGPAATKAVTERLVAAKVCDILPDEAVRRAMTTLDLSPPLVKLVDLSRVGTEAFSDPEGNYQGGGTIVSGEVVDHRIDRVPGGKQARLALRAIAYDVVNVLPINGDLEIGESSVYAGRVTDDELLTEALQQAAERVVWTMRAYKAPTATVVMTQTRFVRIDRGTDAGFRVGDTVIVMRGPIMVCTGRVSRVEPDCAELTFERLTASVAPGDRVRRVFTPPPLPLPGRSIFVRDKPQVRGSMP